MFSHLFLHSAFDFFPPFNFSFCLSIIFRIFSFQIHLFFFYSLLEHSFCLASIHPIYIYLSITIFMSRRNKVVVFFYYYRQRCAVFDNSTWNDLNKLASFKQRYIANRFSVCVCVCGWVLMFFLMWTTIFESVFWLRLIHSHT